MELLHENNNDFHGEWSVEHDEIILTWILTTYFTYTGHSYTQTLIIFPTTAASIDISYDSLPLNGFR